MIVADRKSVSEIREMIQGHKKVLLMGCGTCVTVCLAGGERETGILGSAVRMALKLAGKGDVVLDECTIERQCEDAFIDVIASRVDEYDAILSLGCGAGVQNLADRFPKTAVYPGLNTQFMGVLESQGVWTEKCAGCGNCRLGEFAGICPFSRCAKKLLNGPCGGSQDGRCEVHPELECGWQLIYDRARNLGIVDRLEELAEPQDWSTSFDGGPRKVVREDQHIQDLERKA
jgi:ferredoxin